MGRKKQPPAGLRAIALGEAADQYLQYLKTRNGGRKGSTYYARARATQSLIECFGKGREVWTLARPDFGTAHMSACLGDDTPEKVASRLAQGLRPRPGRSTNLSQDQMASHLRKFADWCVNQAWLSPGITVPAENYTPTGGDRKRPVEKVKIPSEEWSAILNEADAIHPRMRMAVALQFFCTVRISEACLIQWMHIDWSAGFLTFYIPKRGKHLALPLNAEIREELARWRLWATGVYGEVRPDWFLVPGRARAEELAGSTNWRAFRREPRLYPVVMDRAADPDTVWRDARQLWAARGYGPNEGTGTHTFRRSSATVLDRLHGARVAQKQLGHERAQTTQIYTGNDVGDEDLRRIVGSGNSLFGLAVRDAEIIPFPPRDADAS